MRRINAAYRRAVLLASVGMAGLGAVPAFADETAPVPAPAVKADTNELETIVVTARRREEKSQDVPIAITAFSTKQLAQQSISQAQDLQANVPSLVVGQNGQGIREASTFTLRGQGTTFEGSSGVATYLNEVPLPTPITLSNQGGPGNFLDLANLQVLAGPQGTLFGRNTTGGAVLLVPNRPTDRWEGYLQGTYGNYNDREFEGVVNAPIVPDVLKLRIAAQTKDRDGYTFDHFWNVARDDTHYWTVRIGLDFSPSSNFDNYTMAYITHSHNNGPGTINESINVPGLVAANAYEYTVGLPNYGVPPGVIGCDPTNTVQGGLIGCAAAAKYYGNLASQAQSYGPRGDALDVNEFSRIKTWAITNTTKWQVASNTAIRNIVSYSRYEDAYALDEDGTPAPQYDTGYNGYGGNPASSAYPRDSIRDITEELQVQGTALNHSLTYTVGGFYFDMSPTGRPQTGLAVDSCTYNLIAYATLAGANPQTYCAPFVSTFTETNRSKAVYAQATYDLGNLSSALDKIKFTGGVRYTWDHIYGTSTYAGGFSADLKSSSPTWTAGLDYKPSRDLLFYGKVSRGYKAGGVNTYAVYTDTETFGPEYNTTYEIGLKSEYRIGDVPTRFNLSLYRTDYSKIQRAAGDTNASGVAGAVILSNASAIIQGVEAELALKPVPGLELAGNVSYTDAYYTKFPYSPNQSFPGYTDCNGNQWLAGAQLNLACRPLQYVAPFIASAHIAYDLPLDKSIGTVSAFLSYSYEGPQHTEALFASSQQPFEELQHYSLVNASIEWRNVMRSAFDLTVFATNLTNTLYRTTNSDQAEAEYVASTLYGEPRMYGLRLKVAWGK